MTSKKLILILFIFFFILLFNILGYYLFLRQSDIKIPVSCDSKQYLKKENSKKWNTYYDEKYDYSVNYPANLDVSSIYKKKMITSRDGKDYYIIDGGVSFSISQYGVISIMIFDNQKFSSLDEFVENENKKSTGEHVVIEKNISIDGYEAIVTYMVGNHEPYEEYKSYKKTVFLKDNKLFVIHTRMKDHEKVWNSFKFKS